MPGEMTTMNQAVQQAVNAVSQATIPTGDPRVTATAQPSAQQTPMAMPLAPTQQPVQQQAQQPQGETVPQGMQVRPDGQVQVLSSTAYKRLKSEARERGRREMLKELGFSSMEEAKAAFERGKQIAQQPAQQQAQQSMPIAPQDGNAGAQQAQQQNSAERQKYLHDYEREAEKNRQLQEQLDARDAEMILRETAVRMGISDIDYAMTLLNRKIDSMTDTELKSFDENVFFESLKKDRPYLFRETTRPANTGVGGGNAPAPIAPGTAQAVVSANGRIDARKLTPQQFQELMAARGLNPTL
jgi:hypothetical protein